MRFKKKIDGLDVTSKLVVLNIIRAAKAKGPSGRRYDLEWVFHCLLMRIKSPKLYDHIRKRKILPLPDRTSINRYMRKMRPAYGYQKPVFEVLSSKTANWSELQRHVLLLDEMKLQPGTEFDRNTLLHWGFIWGSSPPENQKQELGDHALVVLSQPFAGGWVQSLGCFLSKGNVKGDVLAKIALEGITLSENAGLRVDGIVTDGGAWNRNMWKDFGVGDKNFQPSVGEDDVTSSTTHPFDDTRNLCFFSDWCHLLKCMRNIMCPKETKSTKRNLKVKEPPPPPLNIQDPTTYLQKSLQTPDGQVKRLHWVTVLIEEENRLKSYQLRLVPNIDQSILFPTGFERMNVGKAFTISAGILIVKEQFFSNSMQAAMKTYKNVGIKELHDCEPTIRLLEKDIQDFLDFHKECRNLTRQRGQKWFWPESTDIGLHVSLKSFLELSYYLIDVVKFTYVMTKRFNQDALEHFFGNIRQMAAPNPHPDPKLFALLYRLLSVYSLVSPAKRSNASGVENVGALLNAKDEVGARHEERREVFDSLLDEILEFGTPLECLPV
ncbi:LOW QUALITY PROTEIN: DNA transposase [Frankliniella fusca]|uniref:DNA transposase n=1 Tax=Frankliniella fusca TaxID=407009 RepID=A0AAE1LGZ9_9NEOP|nr:LOW QUALITY PROTEIN: DNA transposase [Frankliniella fusca]